MVPREISLRHASRCSPGAGRYATGALRVRVQQTLHFPRPHRQNDSDPHSLPMCDDAPPLGRARPHDSPVPSIGVPDQYRNGACDIHHAPPQRARAATTYPAHSARGTAMAVATHRAVCEAVCRRVVGHVAATRWVGLTNAGPALSESHVGHTCACHCTKSAPHCEGTEEGDRHLRTE